MQKLEIYYIIEVLPPEWEFWATHQSPQPGCLALGGEDPRIFGFKDQQGLRAGSPQGLGEIFYSGRAHTRIRTCWDPAQSRDSTGDWVRLTSGSWSISWGVTVGYGSLEGQGHWWQRPQERVVCLSSPEGLHSGTKARRHLTACRLRHWDATKKRIWKRKHTCICFPG